VHVLAFYPLLPNLNCIYEHIMLLYEKFPGNDLS